MKRTCNKGQYVVYIKDRYKRTFKALKTKIFMEQDTNRSIEIKKPQETGFSNTKSQKLATAIYLITGFFSDNEPLKWKLRDLSSKLISVSLLIKDNHFKHNSGVLEMRAIITEITSLLLVLKQVGLISEMNYSIINQEFSSLLSLVSPSEEFEPYGEIHIKRNFFTTSEIAQEEISRVIAPTPTGRAVPKDIKDKTTEDLKDFSVVAVKKNGRQSIIINLLKRKKEIMIKDVSPLINGCSEKTIQRELMSMVHNGVLNKIGEKRWSRYSLAK